MLIVDEENAYKTRNALPIVEEPFFEMPTKSTQKSIPNEQRKEASHPKEVARTKKNTYRPKLVHTLT